MSASSTPHGDRHVSQNSIPTAARLRGTARRFARDRSGNVAMVFGLLVVPLTALIGVAVDFGRTYSVNFQTQLALDGAALAAGRTYQTTTQISAASTAATTFFNQNKPKDVVSSTLQFSPSSNNTAFTVTATSWVKTPFLSVLSSLQTRMPSGGAPVGCQTNGFGCVVVTTTSTAALCPSTSCVAAGGGSSVEVALMLDTTGSMLDDDGSGTGSSKINTLKIAATNLVNIVIWKDQSQYTSKIAIIPFSEGVNVGSTLAPQVRGTPASTYKFTQRSGGKTTYTLTTCATERTGANAYTDVPPSSTSYVGAEYTSNGTCPESTQLQPLTNSISTLLAVINSLQAANSTAGHTGTAWAWYTISPNWSGIWPAASQPAAYNAPKLQKYAILMTDGMYNTQYCKGVRDDIINCYSPNGLSQNQAVSLCNAMKAKGIIIYTVGFKFDPSEAAVATQTLTNCATDPGHFYNATDGNALQAAFQDIALKIASLRLTN